MVSLIKDDKAMIYQYEQAWFWDEKRSSLVYRITPHIGHILKAFRKLKKFSKQKEIEKCEWDKSVKKKC
jgi:hypothetical protein